MWFEKLRIVLACTTGASRWKRTTKCKKLVKQVQAHISLQRSRKECIVRQSRADIAKLLQNGHLQNVLDRRVVQLYKDEQLLCAYNKIEHFCGHIIANISDLTKQSSWWLLPIDVGEAVSSLVFAASRCGEFRELNSIRSLFKERYGSEFEQVNVELSPGNLVNSELKQCFGIKSVTESVKKNLVTDIAQEHGIHLGNQKSEGKYYSVEQKAEVLDLEIQEVSSDTDENWRNVPKISTPWTMSKQETISTRSSLDGATQIYETSIVYLDDIEEKKHGRGVHNGPDSMNKIASTKNYSVRSCRKSRVTETQRRHSFTQAQLRSNNGRMLAKERVSWDGSMDKMNARQGNYKCSPSYVHPRLPEYDDVVAKLKDFKNEYKQHKNFAILLNR